MGRHRFFLLAPSFLNKLGLEQKVPELALNRGGGLVFPSWIAGYWLRSRRGAARERFILAMG
jgi:hypothetical protein